MNEHKLHVRCVPAHLLEANLYCSPKKTQLFRHTIKFLGHWINIGGIHADDEKTKDVLDWPLHVTVQWMKKLICGLDKYVGTLTPLTSSKLDVKEFKWGQNEEDAFNNIKQLMTSLPSLKKIDYDSSYILWLFRDTSGSGLGAALFRGKEWKTVFPIAFKSYLMNLAECDYPVHEQELLAVFHALQKWKMLLLGMKINVMDDHYP